MNAGAAQHDLCLCAECRIQRQAETIARLEARCCPGLHYPNCIFYEQRNQYISRIQADNRYLRIGLMAVTAALALLIACILLLPLGAPQC